jgi:hypothetical protein
MFCYLSYWFINVTTTIDCFPVAQSWEMGTGRYLDEPISTDGCSWNGEDYSGSTTWTAPQFYMLLALIQSFPVGGGVWYTGSQYSSSVTFSYRTDKDINLMLSNTVNAWSSSTGSLTTMDLLLKQSLEFVDNKNYQPELKYFSVDTNTIYPPALQISWDDFVFNTGSSTQTVF